MKNNILLTAIFFSVLSTSSYAQSWSLTGNSGTNPPTNFLGTTDNKSLVFKTNNAERIRILSTGRVGIGSTNPLQQLDVNGNINLGKGFGIYIENHQILRVDSINQNTFLGNRTNFTITTGTANTSTGYQALLSTTNGSYNTGYGANALKNNTSGSYNTALGMNALYYNATGSNNVALGYNALNRNLNGGSNSAFGGGALFYNDGNNNVAGGSNALYNNIAGNNNTAIGKDALLSNAYASNNTAIGFQALYSNTGIHNTATGVQALYLNNVGNNNVAFGDYALQNTTGSEGNTAVGYSAGTGWNHGWNNTYIGSYTGALSDGIYNSIALGNGVHVSAPNQVRIGNSYTTSIGSYTNWSNVSDGRVKRNLKENVPGLTFINKLKPVTYNLDLDAADKIIQRASVKDENGKLLIHEPTQTEIIARKAKQQVVYTGFVAQDVEKVAKELNYDFSGVDAAKSEHDLYGLRYSDFVVPLVKAVQELSKMNDEKNNIINDLKTRIEKLEALTNTQPSTTTHQQIGVSNQNVKISSSTITLGQNMPNPFNRTTTINYTLPQQFSAAKIIITDNSGKVLKEIKVSGTGRNSLSLDASTFSSGTYKYSLIVDGKLIDTKQMITVK